MGRLGVSDNAVSLTGCAMGYIVAAFILIEIASISWMPRWVQLTVTALVGLGLLLLAAVALASLLRRFAKPKVQPFAPPERPNVESLIREAADEGATELDLSSSLLESLPEGLSKLAGLKSLSLYENLLASVSEIGQLADLESLILSDNSLDALPPEFGNLTKLTELCLSRNALEEFPNAILGLTGLRELELDGNLLKAIPSSIGKLSNLEMLNIGENELSEIPPEIGDLTNLTFLAVDRNHLTSLPAEIGNLTEPTSLFVSDNQLSSIPPEIGKLKGLEMLNLAHNPLTSLPPEVLALPETVRFVVDKRRAEAIPELRDRPNVKVSDC